MKLNRTLSFLLLFLTSISSASAKSATFLFLEENAALLLTLEIVFMSMLMTEVFKITSGADKYAPRWGKVLISWLAGLNTTLLFFYFQIGFLEDLSLYFAFIYGLFVSLLANGVYSLNFFQTLLKRFNKK